MREYDEDQQRAIDAMGGRFLVLAAPGCGKTDILAERIAVAAAHGVAFDKMLCLTFTNRAAKGMRQRVKEKIDKDVDSLFIGNIHRFCSNYLFRNHVIPASAGIIDEDDAESIIVDFDPDFFQNKRGGTDKAKLNEIDNISVYITQRKLGHKSEAIALPDRYDVYFKLAVEAEWDYRLLAPEHKLLGYALKYQQYKKEHNLISFSDILVMAYEAMLKDEDHERYSWIQVDEVQDLNGLQMAIVNELLDVNSDFTIMYLGDEQQAIFSFLGAKLAQLKELKQRCGGNILALGRNYRSPKYLLSVFNTYAEHELGVPKDLLPVAHDMCEREHYDLVLTGNETEEAELKRVIKMAQFYLGHDNERLAILVPTNAQADRISRMLLDGGINNFKISGRDMFKSKSYKTLSAVFSVLVNDFNYMAWARLLFGVGALRNQPQARRMMSKLKSLMMTPTDVMRGDAYLRLFIEKYKSSEFVFFDTETTGLNTLQDDIVQIAAYKVRCGEKVEGSDFNVFIRTNKEIPEMLGEHVNPLRKEYDTNPLCNPEDALRLFIDYIGDLPVLGHNVMFDYSILQSNVRRYLGVDIQLETWDSLHMIRCVEPNLPMYKLEYLLKELGLQGQNSHLANEDIDATKSVVDYCVEKAMPMLPAMMEFLQNTRIRNIGRRLSKLHDLMGWLRTVMPLRACGDDAPTLSKALNATYLAMLDEGMVDDLGEKFNIFLKYIDSEWDCQNEEMTFGQLLSEHINDMTSSLSEGDLVETELLKNYRVFVMTIHKGKGLEFENVIILSANDGTYPFYTVNKVLAIPQHYTAMEVEQARIDRLEDARKFYVALSRAKRRMCVSYTMRNSYGVDTRCTPFMDSIKDVFTQF